MLIEIDCHSSTFNFLLQPHVKLYLNLISDRLTLLGACKCKPTSTKIDYNLRSDFQNEILNSKNIININYDQEG